MNYLLKRRVISIYNLMIAQENSGLSVNEFCTHLKLNPNTFADWRLRFVPESSSARPDWIELTGPLQYKTRIINAESVYQDWLRIAEELSISTQNNKNALVGSSEKRERR